MRRVADLETILSVAEHLLRGRYGSWLNQPDEMAVCTLDNSCTPLIWTAPYELRKLTALWSRHDDAGWPQDYAMTTHHLLNLTDDDPDATWTTDDYVAAEARFDQFWSELKDRYQSKIHLNGYRWTADGPAFKPFGSSTSPTLRNAERDEPGTSVNQMLPPQVAVTVTEVTAAKYTVADVEGHPGPQLRNRWGRFYLPSPDILCDSAGRITEGFTEAVGDAAEEMYNGWITDDFIPVMYSPSTGSSWSVTALHVDDIFDVVRSRRYTNPTRRTVRTIDAP